MLVKLDENLGERGRQMLSEAGHAVATIRMWDAEDRLRLVVVGSRDPTTLPTEGLPSVVFGDLRSAKWGGRETAPQRTLTQGGVRRGGLTLGYDV